MEIDCGSSYSFQNYVSSPIKKTRKSICAKREQPDDYGLEAIKFSPKKTLHRQMSSPLDCPKKILHRQMSSPLGTPKHKRIEINLNLDKLQSYNQPNRKSRQILSPSNKTFQRKEIPKQTTKKTLKRIRDKLQTQCQERTSIKVQKSDLKVHTKKLRQL